MRTSYKISFGGIPYLSQNLTPKEFQLFITMAMELLDDSFMEEQWFDEDQFVTMSALCPHNLLWKLNIPHTIKTISRALNIKPKTIKKFVDLNMIRAITITLDDISYETVCINPYIITAAEDIKLLSVFKPLKFKPLS